MKTFKYALIQILFCAVICAISGYATVFLLDKQFTNTIIGTTLSLSNILGVLLQQLIATFVDNSHGKIKARHVVLTMFMIMSVCSILLYFIKGSSFIFLGLFIIIFLLMGALNPFINQMVFEVDQEGKEINFGLARGMGSASYAIASLVLGNLTASYGTNWLPLLYLGFALLAFVVCFFFDSKEETVYEVKEEKIKDQTNFFKKYPLLTKVFIGVILIFFGFNTCNSYLIQIVRNVGGTQSHLGMAMFLAAIVELPAMSICAKLIDKHGYSKMMMIAAIFFGIKNTLLWVAPNIIVVYISQLLQFFSYAFFLPVSVYYVKDHVESYDAMKGQALMTGSISLGGVFAGVISGALLDLVGVSSTLLVATIVTWVGALLLIRLMKK